MGGGKDITDNSTIGKIIPKNDENALREAIEEIIENKINFEEKYKKSIELSMNNFIWNKIIENSIKMDMLFNKNIF